MKTIQISSILIIVFVFSQCGSLQFDKTPPFKIIAATYTNWVGGQPGVRGTNVKVQFTSTKRIQFDSIYFDNKVAKLQTKNSNDNLLIGYFNTSSIKRDIILDANPIKELKNSVPKIKKFPFDLEENEVVISYKIKDKIKYFKIIGLKKVKSTNF
ncbi:hypothetical protein KO506_07120 [Polaribacter vadi]|uniref:hypothetical protein n=1 Tax=Polaribacter TaxID=52959 RepID=UPI001C090D20|nr:MULTISPECIES: hypothetical protein [Polaribacter]MBU3011168.1 hypothetical protein [Polaribacter vadi]MDO6740982.1 hypothetical protein [Polaribacter sp. 1_MG-2023]